MAAAEVAPGTVLGLPLALDEETAAFAVPVALGEEAHARQPAGSLDAVDVVVRLLSVEAQSRSTVDVGPGQPGQSPCDRLVLRVDAARRIDAVVAQLPPRRVQLQRRDVQATEAGDGHGLPGRVLFTAGVRPTAQWRLVVDVEAFDLLPDGAVDPRPGHAAGVQAEQGVLGVGEIGPGREPLAVAPAEEFGAAAHRPGFQEPIDVALDARQVARVADFGEDHVAQADGVRPFGFELAEEFEAALDHGIVGLDPGVQQRQRDQSGDAAVAAGGGRALPVTAAMLLGPQESLGALDRLADLFDERFLSSRGRAGESGEATDGDDQPAHGTTSCGRAFYCAATGKCTQ